MRRGSLRRMPEHGTAFPIHSRDVAEQMRELDVPPAAAGRRLDVFLAESLGLSRAEVRRLLARGGVAVDGRTVALSAKGAPVASGARVGVAAFARPAERRAQPEPEAPLALLASGAGWIAVDKPAGAPVHP